MEAVSGRHGSSRLSSAREQSRRSLRFPEDLDQPPDGGPPSQLRRFAVEAPVTEIAPPSGRSMWLVTSYRAVRAVLADRRFARDNAAEQAPWMVGPDLLAARSSLLMVSKARHQLLRRVLVPAFTRAAAGPTLQVLQSTCAARLRTLSPGEDVDLVTAYVLPVSASFTQSLLGISDPLCAEVTAAARIHTSLASSPEGLAAAVGQLTSCAERLLARRSASGKQTPVDRLGAAAASSEIAFEEARDTAALLLVLATDALVPPLVAGVLHLLRCNALLDRCRADPALWDAVALESCRYANNALVEFPRVAQTDVTVEGVQISEGDVVLTSTLAASWDESAIPDPAEFRVDRDSKARLTFGYGSRACLARGVVLDAIAVALRELFEAWPAMRLRPVGEQASWLDREPNAIPVTTR
jgi:cytochrome P450